MIDRSTVAMRTAPGSSLLDCSVCFSLSLIANMRTFRENWIFATANHSFAKLSSLYKTIVAIIDFPSCIPAIAPFFLIFFSIFLIFIFLISFFLIFFLYVRDWCLKGRVGLGCFFSTEGLGVFFNG